MIDGNEIQEKVKAAEHQRGRVYFDGVVPQPWTYATVHDPTVYYETGPILDQLMHDQALGTGPGPGPGQVRPQVRTRPYDDEINYLRHQVVNLRRTLSHAQQELDRTRQELAQRPVVEIMQRPEPPKLATAVPWYSKLNPFTKGTK